MAERYRSRRGFVLITVLWALAGASAIALAVTLLARDGLDAAANQIAARRAYWAAEHCAALLRDAAAAALRDASLDPRDPQRAWRGLDRSVSPVSRVVGSGSCTATLVSQGTRFDVNRASSADLHRFLEAIGIDQGRTDSLVDAILDWRDPDDLPRPLGAERFWYLSRGQQPPRNGPFADQRELRRVRGYDGLLPHQVAAIDSFAGVGADLIDLWHAPPIVLRTLPGFSPAVVDELLSLRSISSGAIGMPQLLPLLPEPARDSVAAHYPEIIQRAETQPEHWMLISEGSSGSPRITYRLELLFALSGTRLSAVRRRFWME